MKVSNKVIEVVQVSPNCKNRLAYEMKAHFTTVERWVKANDEDGMLTTAKAVKIIAEETKTPVKKILVS